MNRPDVLHLTGDTPKQRGHARGRLARDGIGRAWTVYDRLFTTLAARHRRTIDVPALAGRSVEATRAWAPGLVAEMEGVAEGAGVPLWIVAALNARTEILAEAGAPRAGECSTVVRAGAPSGGPVHGAARDGGSGCDAVEHGTPEGAFARIAGVDGAFTPGAGVAGASAHTAGVDGAFAYGAGVDGAFAHGVPVGDGAPVVARTVGGQCWDWHEELAGAWHLQTVTGGTRSFAGLTEHGILGKIGVNDAGLGVLFNILGHREDGAGGVPVHLVARQVLGEAGSFGEALTLLADAPVSASTVLTVVTADRAASVELSPAGSAVVHPDDAGWLVRTNHFLTPRLAEGELRGRREPETYDRHRVLTRRVRGRAAPAGPGELAELLTAHGDEDGAQVCCHAPDGGEPGARWATLATIALDAAECRLTVHRGGPCTADPAGWTAVTVPPR